jgi:hypothetical protein
VFASTYKEEIAAHPDIFAGGLMGVRALHGVLTAGHSFIHITAPNTT